MSCDCQIQYKQEIVGCRTDEKNCPYYRDNSIGDQWCVFYDKDVYGTDFQDLRPEWCKVELVLIYVKNEKE